MKKILVILVFAFVFVLASCDSRSPVITLNGDSEITVEVYGTYDELGAEVSDNSGDELDVVISGEVDTNTLGTYIIKYDATDNSDNEATTVERTVHVVDSTAPIITLVGDGYLEIEVGGTYIERGAEVTDNYATNLAAVVTGSVDSNVIGTYVINYNSVDTEGNQAVEVSRTVMIVDTEAPVVAINGEENIIIEVGGVYDEEGATVTDNYDTTLDVVVTGSVDTSTPGTYTLLYGAEDSSGNQAIPVSRSVLVVSDLGYPPIIDLLGEERIYVARNTMFVDPGVMILDDMGHEVEVITTGTVDTTEYGVYTLTYEATDEYGNVTVVTRTVVVGRYFEFDHDHMNNADCITPTVCIGRDYEGPIYNEIAWPQGYQYAYQMSDYDWMRYFDEANNSMEGALASPGHCTVDSEFTTFRDAVHNKMDKRYGELSGETVCIKTVEESHMFEIHFLAWGNDGVGTFEYVIHYWRSI